MGIGSTLALAPAGGVAGGAAQGGLFGLAEQRLAWIDARQKQLSQNIANADTPGYKPRDVVPFGALVDRFSVTPAMTSPLHLAASGTTLPGSSLTIGETAPDGNAVSLEGEMTKVADDETQETLVGNLWKSYMGMFMTALGHAG